MLPKFGAGMSWLPFETIASWMSLAFKPFFMQINDIITMLNVGLSEEKLLLITFEIFWKMRIHYTETLLISYYLEDLQLNQTRYLSFDII